MNWFKFFFGRKETTSKRPSSAEELNHPSPRTMDELRAKYGPLAKSAVHLRPTDDPVFSHLGGEPLVPESFSWPEWHGKPLSFLAQLDLAEIHSTLPSFLPPTGLLYFFYDREQSVWGFDPKDRGGWRVLYYNGHRGSLKVRQTPEEDGGEFTQFQRKPVHPVRIQTLPWSPDEFEWPEEGDAYGEMTLAPFDGMICHQVLGHPLPVQNDEMELECQLASNGIHVGGSESANDPRRRHLGAGAKDWKLLLQLDTDDDTGWMWGDAGTLYFWIREQDAANADFSKVWIVLQCG